jgi:pimeloyl-ACP methyl ester carboxylesterase
VDPDRFDTGAFGGRPARGRGDGAMPARVLTFPGGAALEAPPKSELRVRVGGRRLLLRRSGTGPPILLLTGMGMSLATWTPVLRHLRGFECIEVAMPGSAGIVARRPVLTMPKFAALARELLDRLDIARADVLGLSFGGLVAQQLAHDAPTRVGGLVLVSTSCGLGGVPSNPASWWQAMASGVWPISGGQGPQRLVRRWSRVLLRELGAGRAAGPGLGGLAEQIAAASLWSSLPWLSRLTQETLVITGTADPLVPAANASILASRMPRAQIYRVHRGGHMCLLDRAAEVGPVVAAFLGSLERTAINEVAEFG